MIKMLLLLQKKNKCAQFVSLFWIFFILLLLINIVDSSRFDGLIGEKKNNSFTFTKSAAEDEIKNLPGLDFPVDFRQYSGYLDGNEDGDKMKKFVHYWFVESQSDPNNDPVLLWLNGGPGCSSMGGLLTELGPFLIDNNGTKLELNPYSWNKKANVLFIESPTEVGFSHAENNNRLQHNDDTTAKLNYLSIKSFMNKFPQYKKNSFYISGESYAGVYLPTLGVLIDQDDEINFKGVAIGNGYLNTHKLTSSLLLFAYNHGLYGKSKWDGLSKFCCNGKYPSRESCDFFKFDAGCLLFTKSIQLDISQIGVNPYNVIANCANYDDKLKFDLFVENKTTTKITKDMVDRALLHVAFNSFDILRKSNSSIDDGIHFNINDLLSDFKNPNVPCIDDRAITAYLNNETVQKAIHVFDNVAGKKRDWNLCTKLSYKMQYPIRKEGLAPQVKLLLESKRNLTILVYNGDVDGVCNFLGDEWFVDDLGRDIKSDYEMWFVNKIVAGWYKVYDRISFVTVRGSGHMVPSDRPEEAYHMIDSFLNQKSLS